MAEITPAQLALDPCTGSCVITDVNTGEVRALVSYPGYDNNMLANGVLEEYDFTYAQYIAADVNHDGTVDADDSVFLQNYIIKNTFINQTPQ